MCVEVTSLTHNACQTRLASHLLVADQCVDEFLKRYCSARAGSRLRNICDLVGKSWSSRIVGAYFGPGSQEKMPRSPTFTVLWNNFTYC
jgi:hypothetical protein